MNWYLKVLKQYADFSGRARRREFWIFSIFNIIFIVIAMELDNILGLTVGGLSFGIIYFLYAIVLFIPSLAVSVRRMHDIDKSGWMLLIGFIPLIGAIWLIVLTLTDSKFGENKYGPNPKEITV